MVILVTQRVGTIKDSDKIIVIDEGKVESIGTYDELSKNSKDIEILIDEKTKEFVKLEELIPDWWGYDRV